MSECSILRSLYTLVFGRRKMQESRKFENASMAMQPKPPLPKALSKFKEGLALHQQGKLSQAQALYQAAHQLDPAFADAVHHLGIIALQTNRLVESIKLIQQALALDPTDSSAYNNLGMALEDSRQPDAALTAYDEALKLASGNIEALLNRGNVLQTLKRFDQALLNYDRLIALVPGYPDAYNNRGNVLRALGRHQEAIASFDRAIALNPGFAQAFNNKGVALKDLKRLEDAVVCYNKALSLQTGYADAYGNLGVALKELRIMDQARLSFDRAIALRPDQAQFYGNRGGFFQEIGQNENALSDYEKALELDPGIVELYGKRLHVQMLLCNWTDFDQRIEQILSCIENGQTAADPFTVLTLIDSPQVQLQAAKLAAKQYAVVDQSLGALQKNPSHTKIRIGYFSADLREHPVAYLMAEVFEKHDKEHFELYAFALGRPARDSMKQRIASAFDHYIEVGSLADREVAALARTHEIDIAVDLGGFTIHHRPGIFAYRAAPVQVQYIGYLGTMGADYMDYLLADETLIPAESQTFYAEKIAYLPSYQANDSKREIATRSFTRAELGLPPDAFVFCCFNNNYKITPATFDSWMRILSSVKGSVLFLFANGQQTQTNLRQEAERRGIDPARLVFGERMERADYLARYRAADLFLDTLPYNAGTTASDALWAGLPVLTCEGESFASRMCASVLHAIELPELITQSTQTYEAKAIELASDPGLLEALKFKLKQHIQTAPLFNTALFCQHLEKTYLAMHDRSQAGLAPACLELKSNDNA